MLLYSDRGSVGTRTSSHASATPVSAAAVGVSPDLPERIGVVLPMVVVALAVLASRGPASTSRTEVGGFGGPVYAAIESMNGARFVHDQLAGWQVAIADAQKVKGLAPLACKTDKI